MIALSGLIVDTSRVQLAKAVVSSTGDLALNSALADYDTILKEVYGLFAMSQNKTADELSESLNEYFIKTLFAYEVIDSIDEIAPDPLLRDIGAAFSGNYSNLLQMETDNTLSVIKVSGSALSNRYILKNQIVEFIKYRTPVNIGLSFFDALSSFSRVSKQAAVTKDKVTVDEHIEDFHINCEKLYQTLKEYREKFEDAKVIHWEDELNKVKSDYILINRSLVKLMNDKPLPKLDSTIDETDVYILLSKMEQLVTAYKRPAFQNIVNRLITISGSSNIVLELRVEFKALYSEYIPDIHYLEKYYEKYLSVKEDSDITLSSGFEKEIKDIISQKNSLYAFYTSNQTQINREKERTEALIEAQKAQITEKTNDISQLKDLLKTAIRQIEIIERKTKDITDANNRLKKSISEYSKGNDEDEFSHMMSQEAEYNDKSFAAESISALESILISDQTNLGKVEELLESIKYAGRQLNEIASFDQAQKLLGDSKKNNENYRQFINSNYEIDPRSINNSFADRIFNEVYYSIPYPAVIFENMDENSFWRFLYNAFSQSNVSSDENAKSNQNDLTKKGSTDAKTASDQVSGTYTAPDKDIYLSLPSKNTDDSSSEDFELGIDTDDNDSKASNKGFAKLLNNISSTVGTLLGGLDNAVKTGRDNIYVTDYVFNMFSYYTQKSEYEAAGIALKTATGIDINEKHNYMLGAEIEYMLHGLMSPEENIRKTKSSIFAIRFVINSGYALTSPEINKITLPPALAIQALSGGVIPYKLPQVVMQLALSLAESANDITLMEEGENVAIFKSRSTWAMSPQGAINTLQEKAKSEVSGVFNKLIDGINTEELFESMDNHLSDLTEDIKTATIDKVYHEVGQILNTFSTICLEQLNNLMISGNETIPLNQIQSLIDNAVSEVQKYTDRKPSGTIKNIMNDFINDTITRIADSSKKFVSNIYTRSGSLPEDIISKMTNELASLIDNAYESLSYIIDNSIPDDMFSKLGEDLKDTAKDVAGKAVDEITGAFFNKTNEFFSSTFDGFSQSMPTAMGGSVSGNSVISNILVFGYKDYLKMFFFIKLCSDDSTLLRIADVIQLNIAYCEYGHKKGQEFLLSQAFSYIKISARFKVKPLFLSIPEIELFTNKANGEITGASFFKFNYSSILGY